MGVGKITVGVTVRVEPLTKGEPVGIKKLRVGEREEAGEGVRDTVGV